MLKLLPLLLLGTLLSATAAEPKIYTIPVKTLDGQETTLAPYAGKVLLVVTVPWIGENTLAIGTTTSGAEYVARFAHATVDSQRPMVG